MIGRSYLSLDNKGFRGARWGNGSRYLALRGRGGCGRGSRIHCYRIGSLISLRNKKDMRYLSKGRKSLGKIGREMN